MSVANFFDSNILLYAASNDHAKSATAAALLAGGGTISVQVLDEFASVALRKLHRTIPEVRCALSGIRAVCSIQPADITTHECGLDLAEHHRYPIYDSMLLAAALQAGCTTFYTEALQHEQVIDGLTIRNPFRG